MSTKRRVRTYIDVVLVIALVGCIAVGTGGNLFAWFEAVIIGFALAWRVAFRLAVRRLRRQGRLPEGWRW